MMLKDLKEEWFLKVNGREIPVHMRFAESHTMAKEVARSLKQKGFNYRIEHISPSKRMSAFAGIPYGAKYTVAFWKSKGRK
jgi:hypothetical protein